MFAPSQRSAVRTTTNRSFGGAISSSPQRIHVRGGGGDSLETKIRLRICEQTQGLAGSCAPGGSGSLSHYYSLLSSAGAEYLERIGIALVSQGSLSAKDLAMAAKELSRYVKVAGESSAPITKSQARDVSFTLPTSRAPITGHSSSLTGGNNIINDTSTNVLSGPYQESKSSDKNQTNRHSSSYALAVNTNHSTHDLLNATSGMVQEALGLQNHKLLNTNYELMLRREHEMKEGGNPQGGAFAGKKANEVGPRRSRKVPSTSNTRRGPSSSQQRSATSMGFSSSSNDGRSGQDNVVPPRSHSSMEAVGGGSAVVDRSANFMSRTEDDEQRALAIGSLKPHMVRRIRALNADRVVVDTIQRELERVNEEKAAKAQQRAERRSATREEMKRLEGERLAKEEAIREERAKGREATIKEINALKVLERERILKRQLQHQNEKAFLTEQQSLRAATKAEQAREAKAEEEMFRAMYKEERERIDREHREHRQLLKEGIQEYLGECRTLVDDRRNRRDDDAHNQRKMDAEAMALFVERENKRFGHDGKATKARGGSLSRASLPQLHQNTSMKSGSGEEELHSPDFLLATRDRDRTEATERKMLALREVQDLAAARYLSTVAQRERARGEEEARLADAMRAKEAEKYTRHEQERAEFLKKRAVLVKGLDLETAIHDRRKEEKAKEKLVDRSIVDEEVKRQLVLKEGEQQKKRDAKQAFIKAIEEQRIARFEQILQPMSVKIGNEGDHDYSKSGFAPKRETL